MLNKMFIPILTSILSLNLGVMKKIIFSFLIVLSICCVFIIDVKAQLEDRKDCGKTEDDECFHTPLTIAARRGDTKLVIFLLKTGSSINERNYFKRTALKEAIIHNNRELVKILIQAGADVNDKAENWTPLGLALTCANNEIFKDLIAAGADYSERFPNGQTLLIAAASMGRKEIIETLLALGQDINATDHFGLNSLMHAILGVNQPGFIKFIISKGININATDHEGLTALEHARRELKRHEQNKEVAEWYLSIIKILQQDEDLGN